MFRHRSKLLQATVALVFLTTNAVLLWSTMGASATYAACTPVSNDVCISTTPAPSGTLILNGRDLILYYKLDFSLNSSSAATWHVTINSTQFVTTSIAGTPTRTLSINASNVTAVTTVSACPGSGGSDCPTNGLIYPVAMPVGTVVTFFQNTNKNKGSGTFNLEATIGVLIPGNAYAGTYTSTITITQATGPT